MHKTHALRLKPGEDLKRSIQAFVIKNNITAGWLCAAVGSLENYNIRFANKEEGKNVKGHFEIVGLSGTLSIHGSHIHICVSDADGRTTGGHLLDDCIIYTTAELIIQSTDEMIFKRMKDGTTAYAELQIEKS